MPRPFSLCVSELTIRDNWGRVSKRYRMLRRKDIIDALLIVGECSNEASTKNNVNTLIKMINDLDPNV